MDGLHGLAAWRKLIDDAHIEVAIERHRQCARYGRGGHHQHVRWNCRFCPKPGALGHAEAVLLIDHHEPELLEHDGILQQRVRTDEDVDVSELQCGEQASPFGGLGASCEQADFQRHLFQHARERDEVLLREDLRRCHQRALIAIVQRDEHAE